jgi:hypothetical protein
MEGISHAEIEKVRVAVHNKIVSDTWALQQPLASGLRTVSEATLKAQFDGVWEQLAASEPSTDALVYWKERAADHSLIVISMYVNLLKPC